MKTSGPGSSSRLGHFKEQYRSRFTRDIPKLVADVRQNQNALDFIDECFQENDIPDDFTAFLSLPRGCSTPKPSIPVSVSTPRFHNHKVIENFASSDYTSSSASEKVTAKESTRSDASKTGGPKDYPLTVQNAETLAGNTHEADMVDRIPCKERTDLATKRNSCSELLSVVLEKNARRSQHKLISCTRADSNAFEPEKSALQMSASPTVKLVANKRLSFNTNERSTDDQTSLTRFKKPDEALTKKCELSNKDVKLCNNASVKPSDNIENNKSFLNAKHTVTAETNNKPLSEPCPFKEKSKSPFNSLKQRLARRTEHFRKSMHSFSLHPATQSNQKPLEWNTASLPQNEGGVTEMEEEFVIEEADSIIFKSWPSISSKTKVSKDSSHIKPKHRNQLTKKVSKVLQTENANNDVSDEEAMKYSSDVVPKLNETFTVDVQSHSYLMDNAATTAKAHNEKLQESEANKQVVTDSAVPHCEVPEKAYHWSPDSHVVVDSIAEGKKLLEKEASVTIEERKWKKQKQKTGTRGRVLSSQQQSSKGKKQQHVTEEENVASAVDPLWASEKLLSTHALTCNPLVQEKLQTDISDAGGPEKKTRQNEAVSAGFKNMKLKNKKRLNETGQPKKKGVRSSKQKRSPEKPGKNVYGLLAVGSDPERDACALAVSETEKDGNNIPQRRTSKRISKPVSMWWICTSEEETQELSPFENAHETLLSEHPRGKQRKNTAEVQTSPAKTGKILRSASSVASVPLASEEVSSTEGRCDNEADQEGNHAAKKQSPQCRQASSKCQSTTEKNKMLTLTSKDALQPSLSPLFTDSPKNKPSRNPAEKKKQPCLKKAMKTENNLNVKTSQGKETLETNLEGADVVPEAFLRSGRVSKPPSAWWLVAPPNNSEPSTSSPEVAQARLNFASKKKKSFGCSEVAQNVTAETEAANNLEEQFTKSDEVGNVYVSSAKRSACPSTSTLQNQKISNKSPNKRSISDVTADVEKAQEIKPDKVRKSILKTSKQVFAQDAAKGFRVNIANKKEASKSDQSGDADILPAQLKNAQPRRSRILRLLSNKSTGKEQHFRRSLATFDAAYANTPKAEKGPFNKGVVNQSYLLENSTESGAADKCLKDLCTTPKQTKRTPPKRRTSVVESEPSPLPPAVNRTFSRSPETLGSPQPTSTTLAASIDARKCKTPFPVRMSPEYATENVSPFLEERTDADQLHHTEETVPDKQVHHHHNALSSEEDRAAVESEHPEDVAKATGLPDSGIKEKKRQKNTKQKKRTPASSEVQKGTKKKGKEKGIKKKVQKRQKNVKQQKRTMATEVQDNMEQSDLECGGHSIKKKVQKRQKNVKQQKRTMATEVQDNMEQSDLQCGGHSSGFTMPKHQRDRKQRHNMIIMSDDSESSVEESEGELEEYSPFIHGSGPTCHTARFRSPIESPVAFQDQTEDDSPVAFCKPKLVFPSNTPHVRRSRRTRVIPLEYWRGERADYQQRPSGGFSLACILSPEKRKTPYKSNRRGQKKKLQTEGNCVNKVLRVPETEPQMYSVVLDEHGNEIRMACIKTAAKVPTTLQSDVLAIHKNLIYSNFSAGKLVLGPYIEKEYQYVYNNSLVFYIITGSLSVTLYRTSYTLQTGDYFFVPPGNCYSIKNMTDSNALLTFTQIKTAEQEPLLPSQEFLCPHRR